MSHSTVKPGALATLGHALRIFGRYPRFIVPLACVWAAYARTSLYLKYIFPWNDYSLTTDFAVLFLAIFLLSTIILSACSMMLEMIRQLEFGQEPSLLASARRLLAKDLLRLLPLALVWAVIWFLLCVIEALVTRDRDREREEFNAEHAAETLAGYGEFSLSSAFFAAMQKGVRMVVFLILPGIVWEDLGLWDATKKGFVILRTHLSTFAAGYALTYAVAAIVFLPPAFMFELGTGRHGHAPLVQFGDEVWQGVIVYIGVAWSFYMYLEQMYMASLYYWQMNWQKAADAARESGEAIPHFHAIPLPSLLDIPEVH